MKSMDTKISTKPNPRKMKLKFFKGKGNILDLSQKPDSLGQTTYKKFHSGLEWKERVKNVKDFYSTTVSGMCMIPNPSTLKMNNTKMNYFKTQLNSNQWNKNLARRIGNLRNAQEQEMGINPNQSVDLKYLTAYNFF